MTDKPSAANVDYDAEVSTHRRGSTGEDNVCQYCQELLKPEPH
jgi:hypothetical protein